ncbi:hypothetical protein JZO86_14235 [Enterococcus ureasiticus]|uniref:hypothetical protein n=1 Tax=Enterococcus ureasiticus TaxID=903984 RepID=UPI001A8D8353|nr:hypothetical protein [Enterococcus ureasiticus]MBO0474857.1 hypothetical protein [Enterococcus ureasiticus]
MSTRSMIFQEQEDGTAKGIYVHSDGYVNMHVGVGVTLWKSYEEREKVARLLELGDLSTLGDDPEASFVVKHLGGFSWSHHPIMNDLQALEEQAGYRNRYTDTHIHYERNSELASGPFQDMTKEEVHSYLYTHAKNVIAELNLSPNETFEFFGHSTPCSELKRSGYDSTIAYARDRGEKLSDPLIVTIPELFSKKDSYSCEEFQYLQKLNGDWLYRTDRHYNWGEWLDLNDELMKQVEREVTDSSVA